jgi:hypothetical protein
VPNIQLAVLLDGSGTMEDLDEWETQIYGLNAAILDPDCMPDCCVEITVIQFAGDLPDNARTEIGPIVITDDNRSAIANDVLNIPKSSGTTPMEFAIDLAVVELTGSEWFTYASKQIINISSDVGLYVVNFDAIENARDSAVFFGGIDEITAQGIGNIRPVDITWLQNEIVWPHPGTIAPPFTPGWVYNVGTNVPMFKLAFCENVECIYEPAQRLEGDVHPLGTGNGLIDSADYQLVVQHIVGTITLTGDDFYAADVNDSGTVDSADMQLVSQYLIGTITSFPGGEYIP